MRALLRGEPSAELVPKEVRRRFLRQSRGAATFGRLGFGLVLLCGLSLGCGDSSGTPPAKEEGGVRVLSKPAPEKAKPAMPDPSIWETALSDPDLERGRLVWTGTCIQCHSIGLGGAPLIGNRELWGPRIEKGFETLISHAQNGFYGDVGEMPARGGNASLTDEEVEAAVRFMVSRAQP